MIKADLERLYWKEHLSQGKIAEIFNVSQSKISNLMLKFNIPKRTHSEITKDRQDLRKRNCSKEELNRLYCEQKLSSSEIAKIFGVSRNTSLRWLKSDNILRRSSPETQKGHHYSQRTEFKKGHAAWNKDINQWQTSGEKNPSKRIEVRKKISQKLKGRSVWIKGKNHTEKSKEKMSEIRKQLWQNPEYARKILIHHKPNKQEQKMIEIIRENNFLFSYVGDGKFVIDGKCLDFINYNSKRIIEVFGNYWHTKKVRNTIETEQGRKQFFAEHGFNVLVIWESELRNESQVVDKIKGWLNNGL